MIAEIWDWINQALPQWLVKLLMALVFFVVLVLIGYYTGAFDSPHNVL
jgi:hypothetical protein